MNELRLREGGPPVEADLSEGLVETLTTLADITALRTAVPGRWLIGAGTKVGVVRAGALQVTIDPKISVERLVFLLGYARRPGFLLDNDVTLGSHAGLPEALGQALLNAARRALNRGVLQGYLTVDEASTVLRGRIREADQIRRHFGRAVPLEVTYDEYTTDITENRLIVSAANRLLRAPGLRPETYQRLRRLRLDLPEVTPIPPGSPIPRWVPTRLNERYWPVLAVADLILAGWSFEQRPGDVPVVGYIVSMPSIFEDFVCAALATSLGTLTGGTATLQDRLHLDEAKRVPVRPDFVWRRSGIPVLVADAKYKAEKPSGFPQADLYQMLAYCTVLGLARGHLVYAKGEEAETVHRITGSPVQIHYHAVDLSQEPDALLEQIQGLAGEMVVEAATDSWTCQASSGVRGTASATAHGDG